MAITRLGGANAITGVIPTSVGGTGSTAATLPASLINDTSIGNITALPAGVGGKVLQVQHMSYNTNLNISNDSGNGTASGLTLNITPASTSNKILILPCINSRSPSSTNKGYGIKILRDSTVIYSTGYTWLDLGGLSSVRDRSNWQYLDSPSSSSQITYSVNILTEGGNEYIIHAENNHSFLTLMEIAA